MAELSADDTAAFGRAVTARRAELGLTRKEIATRSGLSYPYVSNIEAGHKQPSAKALHALAGALELRPAELLERADSLARLAQTSRSDSARESWFRGQLGAASPRPARPPDDQMRSWVREVVREELRQGDTDRMLAAGPVSAVARMPSGAASRPARVPQLAPAIRSALPDWLTAPAESAVDLAIQSVVLERLHRLAADTGPDEVHHTIDDALDDLIEQARRHRRKATPKPKPRPR